MTGYVVRHAEPRDADAIQALLSRAFDGAAEAELVKNLAEDGDLFLSLVAETWGEIVGHVAFSPLVLDGGDAKGQALAPLAVSPPWQRKGVGVALVTDAHDIMRRRGQDFVLVLGDPAYYSRFGFAANAASRFSTPYDGPYMQALALSETGHKASGRVAYAPAFVRLGGA